MQQRDQVEVRLSRDQDKKPIMDGLFDLFARKSAITATMEKVISVTEPINRGPTKEEMIKAIQDRQFTYLLVLLLHFGVAWILVTILTFFNFIEKFNDIPFIIWTVLLVVLFLSMALAEFTDHATMKQPKNVFLFVVSTIARLFWLSYAVVLYPNLHIDIIIGVIFVNLVIITLCQHLDRQEDIKNLYLVSDQPWRICFVLLFEVLIIGLYLNIQDAPTAIFWIVALFAIYCYILLNVQLVEFRKHLAKFGNMYLLSHLYFDGDIVFPCYFLSYHLSCTMERSILK